MSATGRIVGFLCGLLLLVGTIAMLWVVWGPGSVEVNRGGSVISLRLSLEQVARLIVSGALGVIGLLTIALLYAAVRGRGRRRLIELYAGEHESVLIAPSELERQLEVVALDADRVSAAQAEVHAAGDRSVSVDLSLGVEPDAEVGTVVADVQRRMAAALAARYGIALNRKPRIEVRYAGDRDERVRHRRPISRNASTASAAEEGPTAER